MNNILILGAGRSSSSLINYLLQQSRSNGWQITVGDFSEDAAKERIGSEGSGRAIRFDITIPSTSRHAIAQADVVISLLPPHLHIEVAVICLELGKHMLNASYVSEDMMRMDVDAKGKGLLFLNECGLDPGIDHMSAMQVIDKIHAEGGQLISFESFTGGLIAPETDPGNPWRYKFTWNPRNVVMAGQATARFLQDGQYRYIPYQQLFQRITPVEVNGIAYEGYANRDSLKYLDTYGLKNIKTMLRGTLRNKGFCQAWNILVQLGCCDDSYQMEGVESMTHKSFMESFVNTQSGEALPNNIAAKFNTKADGADIRRLSWSGLFSDDLVGLTAGTPARILEHILMKKWRLAPGDKDFIVMWHRFVFELNGIKKEIQADLSATGQDEIETAMAKTVGLPLAIAACLLMQGKIASRGVVIPTMSEMYNPVLKTLGQLGIRLTERDIR